MSLHIQIACPRCQHPLKIREEYLGHRVACKFCEHKFTAELTEDSDSGAEAKSTLEKIWEREERKQAETSSASKPAPRRPETKPGLGSVNRVSAVDKEDSSMLIPVRREEDNQAEARPGPASNGAVATQAPSSDLEAELERLRTENAWLKSENESLKAELEGRADREDDDLTF